MSLLQICVLPLGITVVPRESENNAKVYIYIFFLGGGGGKQGMVGNVIPPNRAVFT